MNESQTTFNKNFLELTEIKHVLRETAEFFEEAESRRQDGRLMDDPGSPLGDSHALLEHASDVEAADGPSGSRGAPHVNFIAGVIERRKLHAFQRILWRVLRGNMYLNAAEIEEPIIDPVSDEKMYKNVFVIFAHGTEILQKIRKLSQSLGATIYPVSGHPEKRREDMLEVMARLEDLNSVLYNTNSTKRHELSNLINSLSSWEILVEKEKAVYHTMNLFIADRNRKTLIAEGWCPSLMIARIQQVLAGAKEAAHGMVPSILNVVSTSRPPPTYHKRNKWINGFQVIIDAYGVAKYREINPALFSIITFPFLFAVMFGDLGHALMVLIAAFYLILRSKQLKVSSKKSEFLSMLYEGRYIILLMSLFAIYTGIMYNDILSKSMSIFHSGYDISIDNDTVVVGNHRHAYPIGLDWAWQFAENRLVFTNSMKMKMSIVFGVIHMTFATMLSLFNHLHNKDKISIISEFIPQVLFMQCLFGYLTICIIYKWVTPWPDPSKATPLLSMMIGMFISPGTVDENTQLYAGQSVVQVILILVAVICVPWMLLLKPILLKREHQRTVGYATLSTQGLLDQTPSSLHHPSNEFTSPITPPSSGGVGNSPGGHGSGGSAHFDLSEIFIHQAVHSIEYCLGCVSNTASYLRLWALSLAHAQLSEVLWDMTLSHIYASEPFSLKNCLAFFVFTTLWSVLTIFILIGMEGLSAFLHALRLHWVEFNSKFYAGSGYAFTPFSFSDIE
ncbi:H(+)-transporting V0 sector ATPase subunit a [Coelomomyces lativittatus]|nr:H(+)-transporting V0 sector ATPase subunit a [Coelomomyces lativittatus]